MRVHADTRDVLKAQKWLRKLGSTVKLNGKMTIGMTTALCSFQRKYELPVTGELDEVSWQRLKKENSLWKRMFKGANKWV